MPRGERRERRRGACDGLEPYGTAARSRAGARTQKRATAVPIRHDRGPARGRCPPRTDADQSAVSRAGGVSPLIQRAEGPSAACCSTTRFSPRGRTSHRAKRVTVLGSSKITRKGLGAVDDLAQVLWYACPEIATKARITPPRASARIDSVCRPSWRRRQPTKGGQRERPRASPQAHRRSGTLRRARGMSPPGYAADSPGAGMCGRATSFHAPRLSVVLEPGVAARAEAAHQRGSGEDRPEAVTRHSARRRYSTRART